MKRIDVEYGGRAYSIGGREVAELFAEIEEGLRTGSHWLRVNDGEGHRRDALLLITPGVPIALIPIPGDDGPDTAGTFGEDVRPPVPPDAQSPLG